MKLKVPDKKEGLRTNLRRSEILSHQEKMIKTWEVRTQGLRAYQFPDYSRSYGKVKFGDIKEEECSRMEEIGNL